ncbi:MAG: ABC transporter substrate-binding protein [Alphaproteobacteria bacterium]|nr:ABC transporter substrate-binding protein [Alphaproteobacteria bacterium]
MPTRRTLLAGLGATLATPRIARAAGDTLVFSPVTDLTGLDPFFTATDMTTHHVGLVYETLYALDETLTPRPHLVEGATIEDDGKRWRLTLREGIRFHDGEPLRAQDAVASIRSWIRTSDAFGRKIGAVTDALEALSDRVLEFRLKKPFPLLAHGLAKPASIIPCIMPARIAEIAGTGKPIDVIGTGPYRYLPSERLAGARLAYTSYDNYRSRSDSPSYMAGARTAHFGRVEWHIIPDASTAAASLQKGEIDWMHDLPPDLAPLLRRDPKLRVQVQDFIGGELYLRFNGLHPPFDNPAIRRAVLAGIDQPSFMQAAFGEDRTPDGTRLWRTPVGVWSLGKPMSTDAGTEAMAGDLSKARRLLSEAGYRGERVVILQAGDYPMIAAVGLVGADLLRRMGFNVEVITLEYAAANQRRNSRNPPAQGGWNVVFGPFNGYNRYDPAAHVGINPAFSGWIPLDDIQALRERWFDEPDLARRQAIAREIQILVWRDVPYIPLGSYAPLTAFRGELSGVLKGGATFFNVKRG